MSIYSVLFEAYIVPAEVFNASHRSPFDYTFSALLLKRVAAVTHGLCCKNNLVFISFP